MAGTAANETRDAMGHKHFYTRSERESIAARSLIGRLAAIVTHRHVKDFFGGMLVGLVLFSPVLLDIAGCIKS